MIPWGAHSHSCSIWYSSSFPLVLFITSIKHLKSLPAFCPCLSGIWLLTSSSRRDWETSSASVQTLFRLCLCSPPTLVFCYRMGSGLFDPGFKTSLPPLTLACVQPFSSMRSKSLLVCFYNFCFLSNSSANPWLWLWRAGGQSFDMFHIFTWRAILGAGSRVGHFLFRREGEMNFPICITPWHFQSCY